jgi:hypothetical protein
MHFLCSLSRRPYTLACNSLFYPKSFLSLSLSICLSAALYHSLLLLERLSFDFSQVISFFLFTEMTSVPYACMNVWYGGYVTYICIHINRINYCCILDSYRTVESGGKQQHFLYIFLQTYFYAELNFSDRKMYLCTLDTHAVDSGETNHRGVFKSVLCETVRLSIPEARVCLCVVVFVCMYVCVLYVCVCVCVCTHANINLQYSFD